MADVEIAVLSNLHDSPNKFRNTLSRTVVAAGTLHVQCAVVMRSNTRLTYRKALACSQRPAAHPPRPGLVSAVARAPVTDECRGSATMRHRYEQSRNPGYDA